jgi:hypothetical protein
VLHARSRRPPHRGRRGEEIAATRETAAKAGGASPPHSAAAHLSCHWNAVSATGSARTLNRDCGQKTIADSLSAYPRPVTLQRDRTGDEGKAKEAFPVGAWGHGTLTPGTGTELIRRFWKRPILLGFLRVMSGWRRGRPPYCLIYNVDFINSIIRTQGLGTRLYTRRSRLHRSCSDARLDATTLSMERPSICSGVCSAQTSSSRV